MAKTCLSLLLFPILQPFLLLLLFSLLAGGAIGSGRHVVVIPAAVPAPNGLAWDPTAQHFLVGSRLFPPSVSSISDAGVSETIISDPLLPSSSVVDFAIDDRRRRLLVALDNPAALAAYDLRSPRPHRRLFISSLPDPSASPGGVAVDPATGAAFVAAGLVVVKVNLEGTSSILSKSVIFRADPSSAGLGGVAHVGHGYLLVSERGGAGRLFKVDEDDGAAKEVLGKALATVAEGIAVRSDGGAVLARGEAGARWLRSGDAWSEAAVQDEAKVGEGWRAAAVTMRDRRQAYMLVIPVKEGGGEPWFEDRFNSSLVADFNPCSYSFLVDADKFSFKKSDLARTDVFKTTIAVDWAITSAVSCEEAQRNVTDYACRSRNSECYVATGSAQGYLCNCSKGYEGNPYLAGGCQDVDECKTPEQYGCYGQCVNTEGSFDCTCPKGREGDPKVKGDCRSKDHFTTALKAITGGSVGIFFIALLSLMLYLGSQRKKLLHTKRRFFEQNGGLLLQQQFCSQRGSTFKIYSKEELEKATQNFDSNRVLGRGGQGTVYKGVLEDKTVVAIKRAKLLGEGGGQAKEFAKEMMILSQINHRNVVKLLGCCLEVEVPMLVYEYVPNGTLFHFIHETRHRVPIPLAQRLHIAVQMAEALAYLHSAASPPILHGDVKSANVLLDHDFSPKVSDFGASRLAPTDEAQLATLVQGTCGYLDPEFLLTSLLTVKSDVYSFAVVLLELLTRRKALYFEGPEEDRSLVLRFTIAMDENRLLDIFDSQVIGEREKELIVDVAELVSRCLRMTQEERPTMKEVAESLARLLKQYC